ncbi:TPA: hypothetical protein ACYLN4_000658 [Burkholderia lata]
MIVINSNLCSDAAQRAFSALEAGKAVRRSCWPDGQYIQRLPTGIVGVVRAGSSVTPPWMGPSSREQDAVDWQVI